MVLTAAAAPRLSHAYAFTLSKGGVSGSRSTTAARLTAVHRALRQHERRVASAAAVTITPASVVSQRGMRAPGLLPAYLADARAVPPWSLDNPRGCINLSVAENQMMADLLAPRLAAAGSAFAPELIYYQSTPGMPVLRAAMASYMSRSLYDHKYTIDPEKLIIGAGCNAVLENLVFAIADPGSAVLIPTPYYAAFDFDLAARAGMVIEPVIPPGVSGGGAEPGDKEDAFTASAAPYYPSIAALDAAYESALAKGHPPAALLISAPNNPLGYE